MRKIKTIFFLMTLTGLSFAQEKPRIIYDLSSSEKPWNNIDLNNSAENFQFAIVTDRTGGHRPGVFLDAVKKLNLLQPEFVMLI